MNNSFDLCNSIVLRIRKIFMRSKMETLDWEHLQGAPSNKNTNSLKPMRFKYWSWHGSQILVLHVIGLSIPHSQASSKFFSLVYVSMLAHFKPFYPVLLFGEKKLIKSIHNDLAFSENLKLIMKNWEAICECADERDADWWQKKLPWQRSLKLWLTPWFFIIMMKL